MRASSAVLLGVLQLVVCWASYLRTELPVLDACEDYPDLTELHERIRGNTTQKVNDGVLNIESAYDYEELFKRSDGKQRGLVVLAFHTGETRKKLSEIGHSIRFSAPDMLAPARMNVDEVGFDLAEKMFKITKKVGGSTVLENDVVIVGVKRGSPFEEPVFSKIGAYSDSKSTPT
jgi:hypothetical protein